MQVAVQGKAKIKGGKSEGEKKRQKMILAISSNLISGLAEAMSFIHSSCAAGLVPVGFP